MDPLIKSQLLYQLSYAPDVPLRKPRCKPGPFSKRPPPCPGREKEGPGARRKNATRGRRKPPGGAGGFLAQQSIIRGASTRIAARTLCAENSPGGALPSVISDQMEADMALESFDWRAFRILPALSRANEESARERWFNCTIWSHGCLGRTIRLSAVQ